jgi:hypothetical protein
VRGRRKGSGLGLAIVSELATAMGATVQAHSPLAEGRGTRMVVWLQPSPPGPDRPEAPATVLPAGGGTGLPASTNEPVTDRSGHG